MGILNKLKQLVGSAADAIVPPGEFDEVVGQAFAENWELTGKTYGLKVGQLKAYTERIAKWDDKKKVDLIAHLVKKSDALGRRLGGPFVSTGDHHLQYARKDLLQQLLRSSLELDGEDIARLWQLFGAHGTHGHPGLFNWPIGLFVARIERSLADKAMTSELRATLMKATEAVLQSANYKDYPERSKIVVRLRDLVRGEDAGEEVRPVTIVGEDPFVPMVNEGIAGLSKDLREAWYPILTHALKASGSKPSEKYLTASRTLIDGPGRDAFKLQVMGWFDFVIKMKEKTTEHVHRYRGQEHTYTLTEFLHQQSMDLLKGLVWMCAHFHDARTITTVASLAERSFRKIPGQGPAAAAIGNACLFTLFRSKGLDGIGQLSRLKLRIKQSSTVALIDKYLAEAAADKGISVHEIEDQACDDLGLKDGMRVWEFDGYTATLTVTGPGDSDLEWRKPDGTPQKSVPTAVKEGHAVKLKKLKDTAKQVDLGTTAQRDRIDRMFRSTRTMAVPYFREHFTEHGLLGFLAKRIIWNFHHGERITPAILVDGIWTTISGGAFTPTDAMAVSLWHPATASVADVRAWREFMMAREIRQPLKQAYREVYLLTDAEMNTRTYSNRMAAHLLKQHQFNSLAKTRGWKYALQGAFDGGYDGQWASITLPDHGISAQFWLNEVNADGAMNDTGIWSYMATDQVRFGRIGQEEPMDLVDVPIVAFSEVMRDVDLFVGVASVGNDPEWRDSGGALPGYRDYWQSYSFGDLGEVAKTRKEILTGLLPRLKIAKIASIQDKFLVVKGKLRTYKIHLGSTNILMEPNDQYLCIVPDRSVGRPAPDLFLPFEGDGGLSVIISKAFLLAEDDKIKDSSITSQINRR
jgi:hypothetical protein